MRNTGKQPSKPTKPTPGPAILPIDPDPPEVDQEHGEGSYSGTRDYQAGVKAYLETADVEQDARDAAPVDAAEARDLDDAEKKGRRPGIKTQRPKRSP